MVRRSKLRSSHMIDMETNQQSWARHPPGPGILFGSVTNFPRPRNSSSAFSYGMTHYNDVQNHHPAIDLDLGVASAPDHFAPYMTPSGSTFFPVAVDHGSHDQFPSSSNHGMVLVSMNGYGGNTHFMESSGRSFKKNEEGIPWNLHASSFEYRGNEIPPITEVSFHRSMRNRSGAIGVAHTPNHTIQGNYLGPPFQTAGSPWLDPPFGSNGGDGGTLAWNQTPALNFVHGSNANGGYIEPGNMASNGVTTNFIHLPPTHQVQQHSLPRVLPPMQGHRGHNISVHSQVSGSSRRLSTNSPSHSSLNPFQDDMEMGRRYVGPVPPTGIMIHRPQQRGVMLGVTPRHHYLPQLRIMPVDEVAILDISSYYEVGNSTDQHRDMRLDIDHMSYEELLALGERIGNVDTGILEETIVGHLKTRTYISSPTCINLEEASDVDQEPDCCVICQIDYKKHEKIGTLDCGHEYHLDCIKKWLLMKNACPICKSSVLTMERKDL